MFLVAEILTIHLVSNSKDIKISNHVNVRTTWINIINQWIIIVKDYNRIIIVGNRL